MSRVTLRIWILSVCFAGSLGLSKPALAQAGCATVLSAGGVDLATCPVASDQLALVLTVDRDGSQTPLHIEAITRRKGSAVSIQSFRITSGQVVLSQDQARIRSLVTVHLMPQELENLDPSLQKFLGLVVDLIRPGEVIDDPAEKNLEQKHSALPAFDSDGKESSYFGSYTMICSAIGKTLLSTFAVGTQIYAQSAIVGTAATDCLGRCGPGCEDSIPLHPNKRQYTQECLNHDMCIGFGAGVRACSNEFWAAAPGYLNAPNCY